MDIEPFEKPYSPSSLGSSASSNSSSLVNALNGPNESSIMRNPVSMTSSVSLIFADAAAMHISLDDTVVYARNTIYSLAKFLAEHGDGILFRSLYSFAPDNLAWLWALIDWDKPVDFSKIPQQELSSAFKAIDSSASSDDEVIFINRVLSDAPLLHFKHREPIMIADVCNFIQFVEKIKYEPAIARALFLIYFPRFEKYMENPLRKKVDIKMLSANLSIVKQIDKILQSLIKSRYANLTEYKEKISQRNGLPSYVRTLLADNEKPEQKNTQTSSTTPPHSQSQSSDAESNPDLTDFEEITKPPNKLISYASINNKNRPKEDEINNNNNNNNQEELVDKSEINKTLSYMKLLERSNKLNDDLDHLSENVECRFATSKIDFDSNNNPIIQQQQQQQQNMLGYNFSAPLINDANLKELDERNEAFKRQNEQLNYLLDINKLCQTQNLFDLMQKQASISTPVQRNNLSNLLQFGMCENVVASPPPPPPPHSDANFMYSQFGANNNKPANHRGYFTAQSDFCGTIEEPRKDYSFNALKNYRAAQPSSPASPRTAANKMLTPKTPSTLSHYLSSEKVDSVWPNKLTLPNNVNNRMYMTSSSVTPPPSATFKTAPLSIITNLDTSKANSPNTPSNIGELLSPMQKFNRVNNEMSNDELKHRFFGSPVPRLHPGKYQELNKIQKSIQEFNLFSPYSNNYLNQYNSTNNDVNSFFSSKNETYLEEGGLSGTVHSPVLNGFKGSSYLPEWAGRLPPKIYSENAIYSRKVFLGGLPWDVNQQYLVQLLQKYGSVKLEIPGKDAKHPRVSNICKSQERSTPGYVYIIYEHESSVQRMLADCRKEQKNGGEHYYYTIFIPPTNHPNNFYVNNAGNKRGKAKEVEVIPWNQEDTSYVPQNKASMLPAKIDARSTIFVGALHGMLNAQGLAIVMTEVFGEVIHAGLDTDKYKYPIGSGRVTFRNRQSYVKAIRSKFVKIKANLNSTDPSPKFEKTIQIDPYLEDAKCCKCNNRSFYFCRNEYCLDYYCETCWKTNHDLKGSVEHESLSRQNKPNHI